jgi:hypothetical protein
LLSIKGTLSFEASFNPIMSFNTCHVCSANFQWVCRLRFGIDFFELTFQLLCLVQWIKSKCMLCCNLFFSLPLRVDSRVSRNVIELCLKYFDL